MNEQTYKTEALKTEKQHLDGIVIDGRVASMLLAHINVLHQCCAKLDEIKKGIFYGRPINATKYVEAGKLCLTLKESRLLHSCIGMATECEELLESVYTSITAQKPLDVVNIGEECGDIEWYKQILLDVTGITPEEIRDRNIAKLRARYAGDTFTAEKANNRDLDAERRELEGKKD